MFDQYMNVVKACIKNKRLHGEICDELESHLQAEKDFYIEIGYDETAAELKAVEAMGDPVTMGENMAKLHELSTGAKVIIALFCVFAAAYIVCSQLFMSLAFFLEWMFFFYVCDFVLLLAIFVTGLFLADRYNRRLPAVVSLVTVIINLSYVAQFSVCCGAFAACPLENAIETISEYAIFSALLSPLLLCFYLPFDASEDYMEFSDIMSDFWNDTIVPHGQTVAASVLIFIALTALLVWIAVRVISEIKLYNSAHGIRAKMMKMLLLLFGVCVIITAVMFAKCGEYKQNVQEKNQNCVEIVFSAVQQDGFAAWSFEDFEKHFSDFECSHDETELETVYIASGYGAVYKYERIKAVDEGRENSVGDVCLSFDVEPFTVFSLTELFESDDYQRKFDNYIAESDLIGKNYDEVLYVLKGFNCDSVYAYIDANENEMTEFTVNYNSFDFADGKVKNVERLSLD